MLLIFHKLIYKQGDAKEDKTILLLLSKVHNSLFLWLKCLNEKDENYRKHGDIPCLLVEH